MAYSLIVSVELIPKHYYYYIIINFPKRETLQNTSQHNTTKPTPSSFTARKLFLSSPPQPFSLFSLSLSPFLCCFPIPTPPASGLQNLPRIRTLLMQPLIQAFSASPKQQHK